LKRRAFHTVEVGRVTVGEHFANQRNLWQNQATVAGQNEQSGNMAFSFGAGFGAPAATGAFGAPAAPAFGSPAPAFGGAPAASPTAFGAPTAAPTFGAAPAPAFGAAPGATIAIAIATAAAAAAAVQLSPILPTSPRLCQRSVRHQPPRRWEVSVRHQPPRREVSASAPRPAAACCLGRRRRSSSSSSSRFLPNCVT